MFHISVIYMKRGKAVHCIFLLRSRRLSKATTWGQHASVSLRLMLLLHRRTHSDSSLCAL